MTSKPAVLITGVSTGIGYGSVKIFKEAGYRVFGSVRKQKDADRLKSEFGDDFTPLLFDVTDEAAISKARAQVQAELGDQGLAGLINNAGIATSGPVLLQPLNELRHQLEVNVVGQIAVTKAFASMLAKNSPKPGKIIMISSVAGKMSAPFMGAYAASKHGLEAISIALRRELLMYGIDVVIIGPGTVASAIWDKESAQEIGVIEGTPYEKAGRAMQKFMLHKGPKGDSVENFGRKILRVFEAKRPKSRYAIVKDKFKNWTVPRAIPERMLDRIMAKKFGFTDDSPTPETLAPEALEKAGKQVSSN